MYEAANYELRVYEPQAALLYEFTTDFQTLLYAVFGFERSSKFTTNNDSPYYVSMANVCSVLIALNEVA